MCIDYHPEVRLRHVPCHLRALFHHHLYHGHYLFFNYLIPLALNISDNFGNGIRHPIHACYPHVTLIVSDSCIYPRQFLNEMLVKNLYLESGWELFQGIVDESMQGDWLRLSRCKVVLQKGHDESFFVSLVPG